MTENSNDNDFYSRAAGAPEPDAHGQAALLLVESLIHGLIERTVISVPEAVEIVEVAAEVKTELAAELGESAETLQRSISILNAISGTLRYDA